MARYFDVHPDNPQPRLISTIVAMLADDALIAYPTDSGYALGCRMGAHDGLDRIRRIRHLDDHHHFTLVCADFAQLGQLVRMDNREFRALKAATPGPYTFILPATSEVPRRLAHPRKKSVGVRIPDDAVALAIIRAHGEPLASSSLLLPGVAEAPSDGWSVKEALDHAIDAVVDGGDRGASPTTVVDFTSGAPEIARVGAGDPDRFDWPS